MNKLSQFKWSNVDTKPKMRWWLPGAFIDDHEIEKEIIDMKEAGYGGAEILYFIGIPSKEVDSADYQDYYFGSKQWNDRMKHALKTAAQHNFQLDFTVGPLWPVATPAVRDEEDERTTWGLHVGTDDFEDRYVGELPLADTLLEDKPYRFVAATIAKKNEESSCEYQLETAVNVTEYIKRMNKKEAFQISEALKEAGKPELITNGTWTLFVYYAQRTYQRNDSTGTLVIDHLSREATQAVINYWDENLMGDVEIRELYEKNAGDFFCDSIEVNATMKGGMYDAKQLPVILWTPKFLEIFQQKRGYDLAPYLFCLYIEGLYQHSANRNLDRASKYLFQEEHVNRQIQNDFYQTITELINENHISILKEWANSHKMKLRYQVYGLTTEMTSSLHYVDVPESESLGFHDCIESNLLLGGAVHMEKKQIFSYEIGAQLGKAYEHRWTGKNGLLWQMHQAMAAGINQIVVHGMSYNSKSVIGPVEPIFKWPGLSLMATAFSNEWGNRQPIWEHASMLTSYISRLQWILRQGRPAVDLAIYRQEYDGVNYDMEQKISDYSKAGYSYEFVSSFLLSRYNDLVSEEKEKVIWDKAGAGYKALIVDFQRNRENNTLQQPFLTLQDMEHMIELAKRGLSIIWTIGVPQYCSSYQKSKEIDLMKKAYQTLSQYPTVYIISRENLIDTLENKGILPDRIPKQTSDVIHVHRSCEGIDYYYLYNQNSHNTVNEIFTLKGNGKPYQLNCWNGDIYKIEGFQKLKDKIRLQLTLAPNEAIIIALGELEGEFSTALSEHKNWKEIVLEDWTLTVKSYLPGNQPYETVYQTMTLGNVELQPWNQMKELEDVVGIGTYKSSFNLENKIKCCVIKLGDVKDTFKVIVNGKCFIPNQITKEAEITEGIKVGENEIIIEIATTINNILYARGDKKERQEYGLIGTARVKYID